MLEAGAHVIMLDNMSLDDMARAVKVVGGAAVIEASGGIDLETVRDVAETGVDLISIGGLTYSSRALDISLDLEFQEESFNVLPPPGPEPVGAVDH